MAAKKQKVDLDTKCVNVVRIPLHPRARANVANAGVLLSSAALA